MSNLKLNRQQSEPELMTMHQLWEIYFYHEVFDYLMNMCSVMYGVTKDKEECYRDIRAAL